MPYPRNLQQYTTPGFYREVPASWERRLREISPIASNLDHLRFRCFDANDSWICPERDQWVLYTAKPLAMVEKDRASQFARHWSELPITEQAGRRVVVSDYQHFMWHSQGVYVLPFLILQGEWGGTPAKYTANEKAFLKSSNCLDEEFPIGSFPACAFDERAVKQITLRDRLLRLSNNYDALEKADRPDALKRVDEAAETLSRRTYLDTWSEMQGPAKEFMGRFLHTSAASQELPAAPEGLGDVLSQWKYHFVEFGTLIGADVAGQRNVQIAVR